MTAAVLPSHSVDPKEYQARIRAWTMYDWANSAFATTILAAVLPVYFSQVAGATLPSPTRATTLWSTGLSISLLIVAILSPILGTVSDVMRGKKRFLAIFAGLGILSTAMLVFVGTGDWVLASILAILGRIGFNGSITFYDSLLPHVARPEDQDSVSARGYATGYLGGGLLLAVNIVMIQLLPGTWGARLSFLSVAIWWAIFTIPLLRRVPEPVVATVRLAPGETIVGASFKRLGETIRQITHYRELFKYLIAFLIYNDGIGTIIGVAAIYGAEMGFGSVELILALLLVQFVAIPYSLIFGRLPNQEDRRRPFYLAFIVLNVLALPLIGIGGSRLLPTSIIGAPPAPFADDGAYLGQGSYPAGGSGWNYSGDWSDVTIPASELGTEADLLLRSSTQPGAGYEFTFNGQSVKLLYSLGPEAGAWKVTLDGQPVTDPDTLEAVVIDAYNQTVRYEASTTVRAETAGQHTVRVENSALANPESRGQAITLAGIVVQPPERQSSLGYIIAMIILAVLVCLALAWVLKGLFAGAASKIDTRQGILLALIIYSVIAIWAFFLNSVLEFWTLAWMVAIVQGGSQALSRSLYAAMSPAAKSGEFFGLYGIMEKFSSIIGPVMFAAAGLLFGSSRPAILSLIVLFIIGGFLLTLVNIDEGKRVAREEDAQALVES